MAAPSDSSLTALKKSLNGILAIFSDKFTDLSFTFPDLAPNDTSRLSPIAVVQIQVAHAGQTYGEPGNLTLYIQRDNAEDYCIHLVSRTYDRFNQCDRTILVSKGTETDPRKWRIGTSPKQQEPLNVEFLEAQRFLAPPHEGYGAPLKRTDATNLLFQAVLPLLRSSMDNFFANMFFLQDNPRNKKLSAEANQFTFD